MCMEESSHGAHWFCSRSCVGRNLASLELLIIVASILRRYDFVLQDADKPVSPWRSSARQAAYNCLTSIVRHDGRFPAQAGRVRRWYQKEEHLSLGITNLLLACSLALNWFHKIVICMYFCLVFA